MNKGEKHPTIYYVWNYLEWGGAQIYFFGLIKEAKRDFDVRIILPEKSDNQLLQFIKDLQVPYDLIPTFVSIKPASTLKGKLKKHLQKFKSENLLVNYLFQSDLSNSIVHIEFAPWQSLLSLIRLSLKTKVFITTHNSLPNVSRWRYLLWKNKLKIISQFKNFNVFCSNVDAKNYFKQFYSLKLFEKIKVTYTYVTSEEINQALSLEIDRKELGEKYNIPVKKFLVFSVGQFIDRKGRWTFLEAAKKVCDESDEIAFVWVSNSKPDKNELKIIEKFHLDGKFRLIISDEIGKERIDLLKLFRLADVFALPSFQEGLPISLLEAMALGIPSISTNVNAIPEAVKNLETGILIEPGNTNSLAEAILKLKNDKNLREKLSKNGREFVLNRFEQKPVSEIAIESYKKALCLK